MAHVNQDREPCSGPVPISHAFSDVNGQIRHGANVFMPYPDMCCEVQRAQETCSCAWGHFKEIITANHGFADCLLLFTDPLWRFGVSQDEGNEEGGSGAVGDVGQAIADVEGGSPRRGGSPRHGAAAAFLGGASSGGLQGGGSRALGDSAALHEADVRGRQGPGALRLPQRPCSPLPTRPPCTAIRIGFPAATVASTPRT